MFKELLRKDFDAIAPSDQLLDKVSQMMAQENERLHGSKKPPLKMTVLRYAGIAAALMITGGSIYVLNRTAGNGVDVSGSESSAVQETAQPELTEQAEIVQPSDTAENSAAGKRTAGDNTAQSSTAATAPSTAYDNSGADAGSGEDAYEESSDTTASASDYDSGSTENEADTDEDGTPMLMSAAAETYETEPTAENPGSEYTGNSGYSEYDEYGDYGDYSDEAAGDADNADAAYGADEAGAADEAGGTDDSLSDVQLFSVSGGESDSKDSKDSQYSQYSQSGSSQSGSDMHKSGTDDISDNGYDSADTESYAQSDEFSSEEDYDDAPMLMASMAESTSDSMPYTGSALTYDSLMNGYLLGQNDVNFIKFEITGEIPSDEAYEMTGDGIFLYDMRLYRAHAVYDLLNSSRLDLDFYTAASGSVYEAGRSYAAYFPVFTSTGFCMPEYALLYETDGEKAYHTRNSYLELVSDYTESFAFIYDDSKELYIYTLDMLAQFLKNDWTARGFEIKALSQIDNKEIPLYTGSGETAPIQPDYESVFVFDNESGRTAEPDTDEKERIFDFLMSLSLKAQLSESTFIDRTDYIFICAFDTVTREETTSLSVFMFRDSAYFEAAVPDIHGFEIHSCWLDEDELTQLRKIVPDNFR